jgi:signal transduction histidine kinase
MSFVVLEPARRLPGGRRLINGTMVAFGIGLTALAAKTPWSLRPLPVIIASGVAASVALWWSRERPASVTLVAAFAYPLSGNPWPLLVGAFASAASHRDRLLPVLALAVSLSFASLDWLDDEVVAASPLLSAAVLTAAVMVAGAYLGTRQELMASLRARADQVEAERELRDEQARAAERARIAREMHDVLAHKVSLIALHAGALEVNPDAGAGRVEEVAGLIGATARDTLEELRTVLGVLRRSPTGPLEAEGGDPFAGVEQLVGSWRQAGMRVELADDVGPMPSAIARAVYRLVQEGLTNVHKHTTGAAATIALAGGRGHEVVVSVANGPPAGAGRRQLPGSGAGLVGLGERIRLLGGSLYAGPQPGGGWTLEARLPWSGRQAAVGGQQSAEGGAP